MPEKLPECEFSCLKTLHVHRKGGSKPVNHNIGPPTTYIVGLGHLLIPKKKNQEKSGQSVKPKNHKVITDQHNLSTSTASKIQIQKAKSKVSMLNPTNQYKSANFNPKIQNVQPSHARLQLISLRQPPVPPGHAGQMLEAQGTGQATRSQQEKLTHGKMWHVLMDV